MTQAPEVSVIIPVYNAMPYLGHALDSILNQSLRNIEIICVDDGSTDGSLQTLRKYQASDERIVIASQANAGASIARNLAIDMARAEFVATLDADDYCSPDRLEKQLAFLKSNKECAVVGSFAEHVDEYERPITVVTTPTSHDELNARAFEFGECPMCGPALMFRKEIALKIGKYRNEYNYIEDFDILLRFAEVGELACIPSVLYYYRQLPASISRTKKKEQRIRVENCIRETRERRGINPEEVSPIPKLLPYEVSMSRHYVNIAVQSILGGNPETARSNAFAALQLKPWHPFPWAAYALSFMPSSVTRSLVRNVIGRDV